MKGHLLLVRSLNFLLRQDSLTYLACRLMAETIHPDCRDQWTDSFLARKVPTGRRQVYWKFSLFKGVNKAAQPEYRVCLVASPTTQLAETFLLDRLSQEPALRPSPFVYSYLWPRPNSSHVFQHFMNGYFQRNIDIAEASKSVAGSRVVILDIKQFYPSIDRERALRRFRELLRSASLSPTEGGHAASLVEQLLSVPKVPGVPVGPALAHVVASTYLRGVDSTLSERFPGRYFRYVDDLAVVVPGAEVDRTVSLIGEILQDEGLKLNDDKKDVVPGHRWADRTAAVATGRTDHGFRQLMYRLQLYLARFPASGRGLSGAFNERGFCLPFSRLQRGVEYNPFRKFLRWLLYRSPLLRFWAIRHDSPAALLETAEQTRAAFTQDARAIAQRAVPIDGVERRWFVQDCRFVFNRLAYLTSPERYREVIALIPSIPELAATTVVYKSLATNDATMLLDYPGPPVSAFAQIWSEANLGRPKITLAADPAQHERDSMVTLAIHGLATPSADWIRAHQSPGSRLMLRLASGEVPSQREVDDFSYIDEVQSLLMTPGMDWAALLKSRFDDDEDVFMPALGLGGGDYQT